MRDLDSGHKTTQQHSRATVSEFLRRARQKEAFIWIDWIVTVGALVAISTVSLALNWPIAITGILILLTAFYGFCLALLVLPLFDKSAFT